MEAGRVAVAGEGVSSQASKPGEPSTGETVRIRALGSGGAGVGTLSSGKTVFVPRTAPGDKIRVRLTREKERWAEGRIVEVVEAGEGRTSPPCPLFGQCGGCALQHLVYEDQLIWKGRIIADALSRIGGHNAEPPPVRPSPGSFRYRNRVTFSLRRLATGGVVAGFHHLEEPKKIIDVGDECMLPTAALTSAWPELRSAWGTEASRLPGGDRLRLTLRSAESGVDLVVRGGWGRGEPEAILHEAPALRSIWKWTRRSGLSHLAGERRTRAETWEGQMRENPVAFSQVNPAAAEMLVQHVLGLLGDVDGSRVVDAFCGAGVYGRTLAARGAECVGIEVDPEAAAVAGIAPPDGWSVLEGKVEERLPDLLPADLVLLNPPRRGLHEKITATLRRSGAPKIVYVSCDPATLARDLRRLGEGYTLEHLEAFDLFPQTAHVETVAYLTSSLKA